LLTAALLLPCVLLRLSSLQEKDRAKFGPEYGDRFCMLQLVGRHEMDKVQLQHESEGGHKLMVSTPAARLQAGPSAVELLCCAGLLSCK
jgi:hypothetical protein